MFISIKQPSKKFTSRLYFLFVVGLMGNASDTNDSGWIAGCGGIAYLPSSSPFLSKLRLRGRGICKIGDD